MRRGLVTPVVLLVVSAGWAGARTAGAQASGGRAADSAYIAHAESDWAESMATNDVTVLERLLADDFVETARDGTRMFKSDVIAWYRTHDSEFLFNHVGDFWIRISGDVAITQGTENWKKKNGATGKYVWTDTWAKRDGKWQAVASASQETVESPARP
jgi:hypothetical protein